MIRRPPRSTLSSSSAASDVYKRQAVDHAPQHRGHPVGDVRIQHLLARRIEGSDRLAGAVGDGADTLRRAEATVRRQPGVRPGHCLLYTSDAADEEDSVDLGGRRIIKK